MLKLIKSPSECKICSAAAFNTYYGARSCEPCKVFFKRNAENQKKILKCDFDGNCQINVYNRHVCSACRLKKCFEVGMSSDMIRAPQVTKNRKRSKLIFKQSSKFPTLNLLEQDHSLLDSNQWTLVSNLIHSYDENSALLIGTNFIKELESLPPKIRFKIDPKKVVEVTTIFYQVAETFTQSNRDLTYLTPHDRSIVLYGAIDNVTCLGGGFLLRHSGLIANLAFRQGIEKTYGTIPYNLTLTIVSLLDQDVILVKLALALFCFCTSNCTIYNENNSCVFIQDYHSILCIQNRYAELIWKYLIYKYSFDQAVVRFVSLVQCLIIALTVRTHLQTVKNHTDVFDSVIQKIEQHHIDINDD